MAVRHCHIAAGFPDPLELAPRLALALGGLRRKPADGGAVRLPRQPVRTHWEAGAGRWWLALPRRAEKGLPRLKGPGSRGVGDGAPRARAPCVP